MASIKISNLERKPDGGAPLLLQAHRSIIKCSTLFLAERRSTPIWCRRARISAWRAACERNNENIVERNRHRALNMG